MAFKKFSWNELQRNGITETKKWNNRNTEKYNRLVEYHKGYLGYKEKHLHLLSGYKLKFDVSWEIWNTSSEATPMFPLTAAI